MSPEIPTALDDGDDQLARVFPSERYLQLTAAPTIVSLSPNEKKAARRLIAKFLGLSEQNRHRITYTQARPFDPTVYPDVGYRGDCSSYPTQAFRYADLLLPSRIHDPNGIVENDGYGFTGTLLSTNHGHRVPLDRRFFIGDIAIFGTFYNTKHATVCKIGGFEPTAVWSSHGGSSGPLAVRLRYRSDLLGVYRPVSLL